MPYMHGPAICRKCGATSHNSEILSDDGTVLRCRHCGQAFVRLTPDERKARAAEYHRKWVASLTDRERELHNKHRRVWRKQYYAKHPEAHERDREYARKYRATHREQKAAYGKAYYAEHAEQICARKQAHYAAHKDELAAERKRRLLDMSTEDREREYERQRAYRKAYREANRDRVRADGRKHYAKHRDEILLAAKRKQLAAMREVQP